MTIDETTAVAVALGRIEERLKSMEEKIDHLAQKFDVDHTTLNTHEARLAVLESKAGGWKTAATIVSPLVALGALIFTVLQVLYG